MNDRQAPYGHVYGYDEYGRPLYVPVPDEPGDPHGPYVGQAGQQPYDPHAQDAHAQDAYGQTPYGQTPYGQTSYGQGTYGQTAYGQDPSGQESFQQQSHSQTSYDQDAYLQGSYGQDGGYSQLGYPQAPQAQEGYGSAPAVGYPAQDPGDYGAGQQAHADSWETAQQPPVSDYDTGEQPPASSGDTGELASGSEPGTVPPQGGPVDDEYQTEQFSFIEEDEKSEDVIDWLKFSESRTERREEAKRRGRGRRRLLVFGLVLAVLGGTGVLWFTDRLPGFGGTEDAAEEAERRGVIVVHLRETESENSSTLLLVANETAESGTTLLLPNDLGVAPADGTTTLGQAITDSSAGHVRDALGGLLGAEIKGTWRLGTPYLLVLVDVVGGIALDTDTEVPAEDGEEMLVEEGEEVTLDGRSAIAYATYRAADEPQTAQLQRFGQVMRAVLDKMSTDGAGAAQVVEALAQVPDPSLSDEELAASLAELAGYAQNGSYTTALLPVEEGGTLSDETSDGLVNEVLGGAVSNADPDGAARVRVRDATGAEVAETARVALVNGGFSVIDSRASDEVAAQSQVRYSDPAHLETAVEVARTLGLTEKAVAEADAGSADVSVVLGEDYEG